VELAVVEGETLGLRPLPDRGAISIGRSSDNDIALADSSVSRRHAILHVGPPLEIEDLGGPNGTRVRYAQDAASSGGTTRQLLVLAGRRAAIGIGDVISLGSATLVVRRAARGERHGQTGAALRDPATLEVQAQARVVAASRISVLLLGETGVGKEVLARSIHEQSQRSQATFLGVNCAALAESLLESELFGHEKGAFTGALQARPGLFEAADGGTLFLDEVGDLPPATQVKLLRVLEEQQVLRVGARTPRPVDVRVIAATNRHLEQEIARGAFREDLFYRLNGLSIVVPPLRQRSRDVEPLALRFIEEALKQLDRRRSLELSSAALALLESYPWPGNVRELRNVIERAVLLCEGTTILPQHLPQHVSAPPARPGSAEFEGYVSQRERREIDRENERRRIVAALDRCSGNQTEAAALLGISRRTLITRMEDYELPRPRKDKKAGG
jgi:transcriptional regulator with PAS, ATPase and Fis domain